MIPTLKNIITGNLTIIFLLFFVFSFLYIPDHSFDQDLGRHIKLGEIILSNREVPKTNLFSYTYPDFPFVNHHYLFEVLVYLGQETLGIFNLLIIKILLILLTVFLTLKNTGQSSKLLILPAGFIFLHLLRERVELRPEIFSFFFTAVSYYILNRYEKEGTKWIFVLPLIQLLWINIHIYFPLGLILQSIFLLNFWFKKRTKYFRFLLTIFTTSIIISLINPNDLEGFFYPFKIFDNYGYTIAENQNLFFLESLGFQNPNFFFVKLSSILVILSLISGLIRQTLNLKNLLISLTGLGLALIHVRSFPYLVYLALPATLENFGPFNVNKKFNLLLIGVIVLLLGESFFYLSGDYYKYTDSNKKNQLVSVEHGKEALDFVLNNNLPEPFFNNFDIGSYIIYRGYPKYQVFVDGRPESYPEDFFQKTYIPIQENYHLFQQLDQKIGFQTIIFSHTDQTPWGKSFISSVTKDPGWKTVFLDDFMIVLVKSGVAEDKNLKQVDFSQLNPQLYRFNNYFSYARMSLFLYNNQSTSSAKLFTQATLEINPESPLGNFLMSALTLQQQDFANLFYVRNYQEKTKNFVFW